MSREEASEIFSQRLEHLGFIDNIIRIGVAVVLLIILPFLDFFYNTTIRKLVSPVAQRLAFITMFSGMSWITDQER